MLPVPRGAAARSLAQALDLLAARTWDGVAATCGHPAVARALVCEVRLRHPALPITLLGAGAGPVIAALAATGVDPALRLRRVPPIAPAAALASLHDALDRALDRSWLDLSPIAARPGAPPWAYQATLRTPVDCLRREPELRHLARALGRGEAVDGRLRRLAVALLERADLPRSLVLELDTDQLERGALGTGADPLDAYAPWLVLGFSRRRFDAAAGDLPARRQALEERGYRVAVGGPWDPLGTLIAMRSLRPDAYRVHAPRVFGAGAVTDLRQMAQVAGMAGREGAQVLAMQVRDPIQQQALREAGCTLFHGRAQRRGTPA